MKKEIVISATESEIIAIINKAWPALKYDSIVANEELGNQTYQVDVSPISDEEEESLFEEVNISGAKFQTPSLLSKLCKEGALEKGTYLIDCTW